MNDLREIEKNAKALMTAHGVGSLRFEFDRGKRRIGAMHYQRIGGLSIPIKITLSRHFAGILTMDEIRKVMLHEIAHALTPGDSHGPRWKAKARELGVEPKPCVAASASPAHSVEGKCRKCGTVFSKGHRLPLRVYFHRGCGTTLDGGVGDWYRDGIKVHMQDMPTRYRAEYERIERRNS